MNDLRKDDGFILVVVIGILTILSLLTITFATLSRIEIRATRNYTDSVKCEMVAKAGLEHAIYELRLDKFGTDTLAYNDNDNNNYGLDENFDASGTSWPGNSIFPGTDYDNDGVGGVDSAWIYLPGTSTATTAIRLPGNLLARYAVLITDDRAARVNINVSGDQPGVEGTSTTEIDMSNVIGLAPGLDSLAGDTIAGDIINRRSTMPFGVLTEAEIVGIAGTSTAYRSRLEESFAAYIGAYEDRKGTLTAFSADTILTPPYGTSTIMLNINAPSTSIQMIVDALTAGGMTEEVERQQLAVNINDFIDSDYIVTVNSVGTNTYYGTEKTPYINEVEAEVNNPVAGVFGKYIELFNPYDSPINIANWKITFSGPTTITLGTVGTTTVNARDYYVVADNAQAYESDFDYEGGGTAADLYDANINSLSTTGETLTLKNDSNNTVQVTNYGQADSTTNTRQLNDPRPTPLMDADGTSNVDASIPWRWDTGSAMAGTTNATLQTGVGGIVDDWQNDTDYINNPKSFLNSFVISNNSFLNKGYLAYIHTGRQWSSFKVFEDYVGDPSYYPNVFKYITVIDPSPEYRIPGLINVNTASNEVLQSLPNIDSNLANDIATSGSKPFTSIGEVANVFTGISGNKWEKEKIFRSISNLITTRSNVFTVYVTAQVTDEALTVFAEKRILAIVDRSVNPIKIRYFRWITE